MSLVLGLLSKVIFVSPFSPFTSTFVTKSVLEALITDTIFEREALGISGAFRYDLLITGVEGTISTA